jgi:hypothetical protein
VDVEAVVLRKLNSTAEDGSLDPRTRTGEATKGSKLKRKFGCSARKKARALIVDISFLSIAWSLIMCQNVGKRNLQLTLSKLVWP